MIEYSVIKRFFDIIFAILFLIILLPIIFIFLFLVFISDQKSPIFVGERIGKNGKKFKIYKIRSMNVGSENLSPTTAKKDTRVTYIGRFIRFMKIDELLQLFNILFGDMSFVGPRPEIKEYVNLYTEEDKKSLLVKPGITDYSSIKFVSLFNKVGEKDAHEYYKKYVFKEKNKLRIKYVKEISFINDFKILLKTFFTLILRLCIQKK
tara:strand:+ start:1028 stop:1648 length:621 start_codon:yes stop_codon:yes gene_type:complete